MSFFTSASCCAHRSWNCSTWEAAEPALNLWFRVFSASLRSVDKWQRVWKTYLITFSLSFLFPSFLHEITTSEWTWESFLFGCWNVAQHPLCLMSMRWGIEGRWWWKYNLCFHNSPLSSCNIESENCSTSVLTNFLWFMILLFHIQSIFYTITGYLVHDSW